MKTFAVDMESIRVYVNTDGAVEALPFTTKKAADKKILTLIEQGYTFDRQFWYVRKAWAAHLHIQAHDLCNVLCDKLYNWRPEDPAHLERVLGKARARLARRERL